MKTFAKLEPIYSLTFSCQIFRIFFFSFVNVNRKIKETREKNAKLIAEKRKEAESIVSVSTSLLRGLIFAIKDFKDFFSRIEIDLFFSMDFKAWKKDKIILSS